MDSIQIMLVVIGLFVSGIAVGVYFGIRVLFNTWLKPGLTKGILEVGNDTYRVSKFVPRNTRI